MTLAGFALFAVALLVTVLVHALIVRPMVTWTAATLPGNWQQLRDRWGAFHIVRVVAGIGGLVLLLAGLVDGAAQPGPKYTTPIRIGTRGRFSMMSPRENCRA